MATKVLTDFERFEDSLKVAPTGCWEWQRGKDQDGYGLFKIGSYTDGSRATARAHRWSYEHFVAKIGEGMTIDHLCRNHCCVNPAHLEPVTTQENTKRGWRANKTHCKRGHPLSGDNLLKTKPTKTHPNGMRACRACALEYQRAYQKIHGPTYQKRYLAKKRALQGVSV